MNPASAVIPKLLGGVPEPRGPKRTDVGRAGAGDGSDSQFSNVEHEIHKRVGISPPALIRDAPPPSFPFSFSHICGRGRPSTAATWAPP